MPDLLDSAEWWPGMRDWLDRAARRTRDLDLLPPNTLQQLWEQAAAEFAGPAPPMRLLHGDADSFHWRYDPTPTVDELIRIRGSARTGA